LPTFFLQIWTEMNEEILNIIENFLKNTDYSLIDFILRGERNSKVLEIFVDSRNPVLIDELSLINKKIWKELQQNELSSGIIKFNVSSPGADKPFKYLWQIPKHTGRVVEIKMFSGELITGKLLKINESNNEILIENYIEKECRERVIKYENIKEIKVKISFNK